jgi:hypothetical protein
MEPNEVVRADFPQAGEGFEKRSVVAHLEAVAAQLSALQARVRALEVELDAVREPGQPSVAELADDPQEEPAVTPFSPPTAPSPTEEDLVAARLVATELILSGEDRDQVIARIGGEHGIPDPAALVDEVIARTG